ncbi:DotU family type IV/VI secretion system protein [Candidatus Gromoviella agglomerans]|uniref:DotU family type IV/VI secretion system protein n=1 Tax=Candidatus Gromoviella agglomerans TaxID=2806609 RepID=UPI001E524C6A|nr:DotU family type IV/VI secretion system protein [Candidatus Gromoviella agglomerans]UFX98627.1 Type VI secretion system TssL protein [Candidatus Gromoviella agglomerans]
MITSSSLLIFEDFYQKLILEKENASNTTKANLESIGNSISNLESHIYSYYTTLANELGQEIATEIQYIMTSIADEVFSETQWTDINEWKRYLLEERIFKSHVSGSAFFDNIDSLLMSRNVNRIRLAVIYFLSISMGFRGSYYAKTEQNDMILLQYKKKLLDIITTNSNTNKYESSHLFQKAYIYTIENSNNFRTQKKSTFSYWISAVIMIYIMFSYAIWQKNTREVSTQIRDALISINSLNK